MRITAETSATLRSAIKAAGFKARVRVQPSGDAVAVIVPTFESRFTGEQIAMFCAEALRLGLTFVQGVPIDPAFESGLTGKQQWEFYGS